MMTQANGRKCPHCGHAVLDGVVYLWVQVGGGTSEYVGVRADVCPRCPYRAAREATMPVPNLARKG